MTEISNLESDLNQLDSAPRLVMRRKREVLKKFAWTRTSQVSNLLRLGVWLDLLGKWEAAERIFLFLSKPVFRGDWDMWSCVQGSLFFLAHLTKRRNEDPAEYLQRALAPGFIMDRVNGLGLERLLKHLKHSTFEPPFYEPISYLLEDIIMELRIMSVLGGSEKYPVNELELLERRFQADLRDMAEKA